jgi:DnaJ-class molecular chaperone
MSARDASTQPDEPGECLACRGTGTLVSGLGGTPHEVRCPWCEGTGRRIPGIDAQAHPAERGATDAAESGDSRRHVT